MQIQLQENKIFYKNIGDYDLAQTFLCGQAFRFDAYLQGFRGFIGTALCYIYRQDADIIVEIQNKKLQEELVPQITHFLALDVDYEGIKNRLCQNETLKKAVDFAPGIRVLNQDFFETLITFIISQNNNIPRIKKLCDSLATAYGTREGEVFAFPTAAQLAHVQEEEYRNMRFGFRAPYLQDAVTKYSSGVISEKILQTLSYQEGQKYLMQIKGVGPKVADCVLLFGCKQYESFPKDVWINRAMDNLFPQGLPAECKGVEGIAQQYIFHYARHHL